MVCRPLLKRGNEALWQLLVGITCIVCSLIIYNFLIMKGIICPLQSQSSVPIITSSGALSYEGCTSMCNNKECIDISKFILRNMNQSADPCEDFYNFACGNFYDRHHVDGNHSVLDQLTADLHVLFRDIIEKSNSQPGSASHKLKVVYESCMKTGSFEFTATQTVLQFLKHMGLQNWPYLNSNFTFQAPTLPEVLGRLSAYEEDTFVKFYESFYHTSDETGHLHSLSASPQHYTFNGAREIKEVVKVLNTILGYIGISEEKIKSMLDEFIKVDTEIFMLLLNNSDFSAECDEETNTDTISSDCKKTNHKNRNEFMLCRMLESVIRNGRIASRFAKDRVYIACHFKYYVNRIFDLVFSYDDRVIANYIALRVFVNNLKNMNFSIRKTLKTFNNLPSESEEAYVTELDRWKFCVSWIADNMQYPLGMVYVKRMWPSKAANEVNQIFSDYLQTTKGLISQQHWIGDSVKHQILKEIEEVENCIYYVIEGMKNETKINALYRKFYPIRSSFMRNVFSHKKFMFIASKLNSEDMRYFVEYSPFVVNAYGGDNIYLTFGILLPPVYKQGYPNLFNIAKIGQIIGHEFGHKLFYFFEYSPDLDNSTREVFDQKNRCLIDQYFKFEMKEIQQFVRGNLTIIENFPDMVGMKITEKVSEFYLKSMKNNRFTLPGLPYSADELLYISYAQMWCTVRSIEKHKEHYERDFHSPPEFRIKGAFQNSRKFSEVFNCPQTSFMNPLKKCSVLD